MPRPRRVLVALTVGALAAALAACSTTVSLEPAPSANDPLCAEVSVRYPQTIGELDRRWTDAQATAAWGAPGKETAVIVSCGVESPVASTLECQTLDGVDWLIDDSKAPHYRFTSYGRSPAVQVYLDYDQVSGSEVLQALTAAVTQLPSTARCVPRPDPTG